jgi:hypothetical protein
MAWKFDVTDLLKTVQAPTLVIHRRGDRAYNFRAGKELAALIPGARLVQLEGSTSILAFGDTNALLKNIFEFLGDPVIDDSADNAGKEPSLSNLVERKSERKISKADSLSHLDEPTSGQNKGQWLRLSNPLVYFTVILLASVAAGIILMLIKC